MNKKIGIWAVIRIAACGNSCCVVCKPFTDRKKAKNYAENLNTKKPHCSHEVFYVGTISQEPKITL